MIFPGGLSISTAPDPQGWSRLGIPTIPYTTIACAAEVVTVTAGRDRKGQDRTGQDRTGQDRTGQDRTGQDRTGELALSLPRAVKDTTTPSAGLQIIQLS